jgi:hypothetical protein
MDLSNPKVRKKLRGDNRPTVINLLDHIEEQEKGIAELEEKLAALEAMHPYAA